MFKPGYCPWPDGFYIESCKGKINVTGDKEKRIGEGGTLELPKLTKREDRWKAEGISPDSFFEIMADKQKVRKIKNFLRIMGTSNNLNFEAQDFVKL